jgi:putative phage-type endonuclease
MPEIISIDTAPQGSEAWHALRLGSVGGCSIDAVLAKGQGKTRKSLMYRLAGEILAGVKTESYTNANMERGHQFEDEARQYYSFVTGHEVEQVSLIKADIPGVHVSPDGLVGDDGGVEIKVHLPHVYVELIDTGVIPTGYVRQCQHFLYVSRRKWIDFIGYSPEITARPMWIKRIEPDPKVQDMIAVELPLFLAELAERVERIRGAK